MIKIFEKLYPEKKIELKDNFKEFFIFGSLEDMEELIGNILENACKWGRKKIVIRFDNIGDNEVKVIFSDDGSGLPNEEMKKFSQEAFD